MKFEITAYGDIFDVPQACAQERQKMANLIRLAKLKACDAFNKGYLFRDNFPNNDLSEAQCLKRILGWIEISYSRELEEFLKTGYWWDEFSTIQYPENARERGKLAIKKLNNGLEHYFQHLEKVEGGGR